MTAPVWSPDGRQIAFVGGYHSVDVVNADGSGLLPIAFSDRPIQRIAWRNISPALAVTTEYVLDDVLPSRKSVQISFHMRSVGGMDVPQTTVALHASNAAIVTASVGTCRLSLATGCSVGVVAADGNLDINVTFRALRPGPISIGASASSPDETDTTSDNTATLAAIVSRCTIIGTGNDDTLRASRQGSDYICGEAGNDTINTRNGKPDVIDGGSGIDTALVDRFDKVIHVEHVSRR